MANTRPGNHEKGWNDPPMFLYNPGNTPTQAPSKRTPLNKRVAHSLNTAAPLPPSGTPSPLLTASGPPLTTRVGEPPTVGVSSISGGPPLSQPLNTSVMNNVLFETAPSTQPVLFIPTSPSSSQESTAHDTSVDPASALPNLNDSGTKSEDNMVESSKPCAMDELSEQLRLLGDGELYDKCTGNLNGVAAACSEFLQKRTTDDINRRLEIFSTMWMEKKLSVNVKMAMAKLAQALVTRQYDLAFDLHLGLMMDHVTEVTQWMVGVKRLIQEARKIPPDYEITVAVMEEKNSDKKCDTEDTEQGVDTCMSGEAREDCAKE